jgi:predicted nucleic acid-binding protein
LWANEESFAARLRRHPALTPTEKNWLESGRILAKINADKGYEPKKLRDLHFDVLIALTVRSYGAKLITSNRADFELIREYRDFQLEVW